MKSIKFVLMFSIFLIVSCTQDGSLNSNSPINYIAIDNAMGDQYNSLGENPFITVAETPVSTFSIDADGASYANVRRFIMQDN